MKNHEIKQHSVLYQPRSFWPVGIFFISVFLLCPFSTLAQADRSAAADDSSQTQESPASMGLRNLQFSHITERDGLSQSTINAIAQDDHGYIWLGTQEGLNRYDGYELQVFEHNPKDPNSLSHDWVWSIYLDSAGTLWVGTDGGGLDHYDAGEKSFTHYQHQDDDPNSLGHDRVRTILQDRNGHYWIGTDGGGLDHFDAGTGIFTHYRHDESDEHSLPGNRVLSILEDSNGDLWVGTNKGLARFNHALSRFDTYQNNPADSNRGLSRLDPNDGIVKHFDHFNGLRSNEFNSGAYLKTRNGQLYFGGAEGVLTLDSEALAKNSHQPELALSAYSRTNSLLASIFSNDAGQPEALAFDYTSDYVEFRFTALDFSTPSLNQYRYRLKGFEEEWTDVHRLRSVTYASLPAGDYVFMVSASNNDGVWNETGISIPLVVQPAPWKTPWAYSLYALFIGGTGFGYKFKQDKKHQRAAAYSAQLEEEVAVRIQELSERNIQLEEMSFTDPLTGLHNRRYLHETIGQRVAALNRRVEDTRTGQVKTAKVDIAPSMFFMMIDLDGFKVINDSFGHAAGDLALRQVRDILIDSCRKSDIIIRWGGDEFLVVGETPSVHAAEHLAERIRRNLAEHQYQVGEGNVGKLSGSIGFSMYPFSPFTQPDLLTWEQVTGVADHAAYMAKNNGRDAWVGVYGTRNSTWQQFGKTNVNLLEMLDNGLLSIGTSLKSLKRPIKLVEHRNF